jgi:uncharacterized damage-inducible protein DinB
MLNHIKLLASYNIWANDKVSNWLKGISSDQWLMHIPSSFPSIKATTTHIIGAEYIWYQRLTKVQPTIWLGNDDLGSIEDVLLRWKAASQSLLNYCNDLSEKDIDEEITFNRLNGDVNVLAVKQILVHVFNHSTYHRGQIVTMLRIAGFEKVASTDLLNFFS